MEIDKDLWLRIGEGDQQAYAEAYRFYYKRFYNYGRKFTDNESLIEDAVQETLMAVWNKRQKLSTIEYISTYFYTSFRHALFAKLARQRKTVSDDTAGDTLEFSIDQIIIAKETDTVIKERLQKALTTLTTRQREAIFLRFYEGLSYEEVATVLNITVKATYKIMARSLHQLKESLTLSTGVIIFLLQRYFTGLQ